MRRVQMLMLWLVLIMFTTLSSAAFSEPKEANIQGVDYLRNGDDITFWVTLYDENDETGESYAAWWQVETRNGTLLGRKTLNNTGETTIQSQDTFPVPQDVRYITVRGYDNTRGYGGQIVELDIIGEDQSSAAGADDETGTSPESDSSSTEETEEGSANETGDGNATDEGNTVIEDVQEALAGPGDGGNDTRFKVPESVTNLFQNDSTTGNGKPLLWILVIIAALVLGILGRHHFSRFR